MTAVLYVIGPARAGKTTLVRRLLSGYERGEPERLGYGPLVAEPLWEPDGVAVRRAGLHLGKTRARHGGTDALDLRVLDDAVRWAAEADLPPLIVGEGARLTHPLFFGTLALRTRLLVVYLDAPMHVLAERGGPASAWEPAQAIRARNVARSAAEIGVRVLKVSALPSAAAVESTVRGLFDAAGVDLPVAPV